MRRLSATDRLRIQLTNHQHRDRIPLAWLTRLARGAVASLCSRQSGQLSIAFIDPATMRAVNRRFTGHQRLTDVLSFRYDQATGSRPQAPGSRVQHAACSLQPIVGEILVAPSFACRYAKQHGLSYREELARYVIHGVLHWIGYNDRTATERRRMTQMEDELLAECAGK